MNEKRTSICKCLHRANLSKRVCLYLLASASVISAAYCMVKHVGSVAAIVFGAIILNFMCVIMWGMLIVRERMVAYYSNVSLGCVSRKNFTLTLRHVVRVKPRDPDTQTDATGRLIEISCTTPTYFRRRIYPDMPVYVITQKGFVYRGNLPIVVPDDCQDDSFKSL